MKHCPNPECPGIENFKIISEFNDSALACSDCGRALAFGPAPSLEEREAGNRAASAPVEEPDMVLVPVFIIEDEAELVLAQSVLKQGGIPYLAKGENLDPVFGFGRGTIGNPISGPVEIQVRLDDSEAARDLLAKTFEDDSGE